MKRILFIFVALFATATAFAHLVEWEENPDGLQPGNPMIFKYLDPCELDQYIEINPSSGEPCTVSVNLNPVTSDYITAKVLFPNPYNWVDIKVSLVKFPTSTNPILTSISGTWQATGFPAGQGCDATNPQPFTVPIKISLSRFQWLISLAMDQQHVSLQTGDNVGLRGAYNLAGPWYNVGKGSSFNIPISDEMYYFRNNKGLGGTLNGSLTDGGGTPLVGWKIDLLYGGLGMNSALDGSFTLPSLPWGNNLISLMKPFTFVDPNTGTNRTETAQVEVVVPATNAFVGLQFHAEAQVFPPPPACNCAPWCALGYGSIDGANTPIYFSGGANPPKGVPPSCGTPQVVVTPPVGAPFPINPGTGKHQNSGPNPASGTWTVTTTVCGQSKSCTLTVP